MDYAEYEVMVRSQWFVMGGNILSAATQVSNDGIARLRFTVAISDASLLPSLLAYVNKVPSVYNARRIMPGEGANQMPRRPKKGN